MRQLGWLHAVPKPPKGQREEDYDHRNRMKRFEDMGIEAPIPEVRVGIRLVDWLFEIGPGMPVGDSLAPLTQAELFTFQCNYGFRLLPWECHMLRRMSQEYIAELQAGTEQNRQAPYEYEDFINARAAKTAEELRSAMRALAAD